MKVLLDTNVLLRMAELGHAMSTLAEQAVATLEADGCSLVIVPQVLYEYWVVATRPIAQNGLGMNAADADADLNDWCQACRLLLDERGIFAHWQDLVRTHNVLGKNAHDARLAAAMQRHDVRAILSFNKSDFARFPSVHVLAPSDVLAGSRFPSS